MRLKAEMTLFSLLALEPRDTAKAEFAVAKALTGPRLVGVRPTPRTGLGHNQILFGALSFE
jgi:hypothetical protein